MHPETCQSLLDEANVGMRLHSSIPEVPTFAVTLRAGMRENYDGKLEIAGPITYIPSTVSCPIKTGLSDCETSNIIMH